MAVSAVLAASQKVGGPLPDGRADQADAVEKQGKGADGRQDRLDLLGRGWTAGAAATSPPPAPPAGPRRSTASSAAAPPGVRRRWGRRRGRRAGRISASRALARASAAGNAGRAIGDPCRATIAGLTGSRWKSPLTDGHEKPHPAAIAPHRVLARQKTVAGAEQHACQLAAGVEDRAARVALPGGNVHLDEFAGIVSPGERYSVQFPEIARYESRP